jgi:hypothetical protein
MTQRTGPPRLCLPSKDTPSLSPPDLSPPDRLKAFEALDPRIKPGAVVYAGEAEQQFQECWLLPFTQTESLF